MPQVPQRINGGRSVSGRKEDQRSTFERQLGKVERDGHGHMR